MYKNLFASELIGGIIGRRLSRDVERLIGKWVYGWENLLMLMCGTAHW